MNADVIISENPTRTYTVPAALTAAIGERATLDQVYACASSKDDATKSWAGKILEGIARDQTRTETRVLASIGYDPDNYRYCGITSGDEDSITSVSRLTRDSTRLEDSETLTADGSWQPVSDQLKSSSTDTGQISSRAAQPIRAWLSISRCLHVLLAYGDPHLFLSDSPLLASAELATAPGGSQERVYAVVDAVDTTAVMDVIMIKPGPVVYRRDGDSWALDNAMLDSLLSVSPPPIVELSGDTLTSVLEQVKISQMNQLSPNDDGTADAGDALGEEPLQVDAEKAAKQNNSTDLDKEPAITQDKPSDEPTRDVYKSNQNKSQLKDGSTVTASLAERYNDIQTLLSIAETMDPNVPEALAASAVRSSLAKELSTRRAELALREAQIRNIILPALLADAASVHDATPNQQKATHLRKYWVQGKGAVKIKWGAPGDFTRCERQLRKYLGSRAKGYCAKRHKEVMGFWPGDKRNTGPNK
ncbi:hypothetical protein PP301_gp011 [Gordonia phage GMA2]|uniref:Uncharacterized protein n=1 Tax=Gordonia phage GMA2 TaxID=1647283 RepID=A0A0K0N6J6_9CAUD|nr:hypothetical protein PP301_gp011 [Gordonia phage GMA2]AKJ72549.1 hypothetical protein GMA2_11 [Gordonia phage GMA2]